MSEEPKGPPKIDVEDILSDEEQREAAGEEVEVVLEGDGPDGGAMPVEMAEMEERLLRLRADFDNYRRRVDRERRDIGNRAVADMLTNLLPVLDNLERALSEKSGAGDDPFRHGVELIYRQALEVLGREGLQQIVAVGTPFNPSLHEAVDRVETTEHANDTVIEELLKGYLFNGKLLRASMVRVAYRSEPEGSDLDESLEGGGG